MTSTSFVARRCKVFVYYVFSSCNTNIRAKSCCRGVGDAKSGRCGWWCAEFCMSINAAFRVAYQRRHMPRQRLVGKESHHRRALNNSRCCICRIVAFLRWPSIKPACWLMGLIFSPVMMFVHLSTLAAECPRVYCRITLA